MRLLRLYHTLAMLFICGLAAFGPAQTVKQEPTERLERRYWALADAYWKCPDLACKDATVAKLLPLAKELDARYQAKIEATTQAIEGKRKP